MDERILNFIIDTKTIVKYPKEECKGLRWWDCNKCYNCYLDIYNTIVREFNIEDKYGILQGKNTYKKNKNVLNNIVYKLTLNNPIICPMKYEIFKENENKYTAIIEVLNRHTNYSKNINDTSKNNLHINFIEMIMHSLKHLLYRYFNECEAIYGLKEVFFPSDKYKRMMRNYVKRCRLRYLNLICLEKYITACDNIERGMTLPEELYLFDMAGGNYRKIKYYDKLFYNEYSFEKEINRIFF